MPETPRYLVRRGTGEGSREVGALYDLPHHAQVCLHTDEPDLVVLLESGGLIAPRRPPFLDAASSGVHGAYRPRPQINVFLDPPVEAVAEAFASAFEGAGGEFAIEPVGATG